MSVRDGFTPTGFRAPLKAERVFVQFRNGDVSKHTYTPAQIRWSDIGSEWDVIAYRSAEGAAA